MNTKDQRRGGAPLPFPPYLDRNEARIAEKLIRAALNQGLALRVFDGEEYATELSRDPIVIAREVGQSDDTTLELHSSSDAGWTKAGWLWLIHGNGEDLLSDYSDNPTTRAVVQRAGL